MGLFGINIGPSIGSLASDWISSNDRLPNVWVGTRADLEITMSQMYDSCGNYVHQQNSLHNTKNGRQECKDRLLSKHKDLINSVIAGTAADEAAMKTAALKDNKKIYAVIALVLIVLVGIVLILRLNNK